MDLDLKPPPLHHLLSFFLVLPGFWGTCMSAGALLAESIRVAVSGLRAIASALEEALRRFDNLNNDSGPAVDLESAGGRARPSSDWGLVTSAVASEPPANTPLLVGTVPASVPALSVAGTDFSTESYHRVACSLDPLPGYCLDLCVRLGGTKEELEFRARRAWEAGLWARAILSRGLCLNPALLQSCLVSRTRSTSSFGAPSVSGPTRVDSAAEFFRLIPSFAGSDSISHAFASVAEARVYCAGVGIALPEARQQ